MGQHVHCLKNNAETDGVFEIFVDGELVAKIPCDKQELPRIKAAFIAGLELGGFVADESFRDNCHFLKQDDSHETL